MVAPRTGRREDRKAEKEQPQTKEETRPRHPAERGIVICAGAGVCARARRAGGGGAVSSRRPLTRLPEHGRRAGQQRKKTTSQCHTHHSGIAGRRRDTWGTPANPHAESTEWCERTPSSAHQKTSEKRALSVTMHHTEKNDGPGRGAPHPEESNQPCRSEAWARSGIRLAGAVAPRSRADVRGCRAVRTCRGPAGRGGTE